MEPERPALRGPPRSRRSGRCCRNRPTRPRPPTIRSTPRPRSSRPRHRRGYRLILFAYVLVLSLVAAHAITAEASMQVQDRSGTDVPEPISVIVTPYNREDALAAVLSALSRQSDRDFEVVVADDGSNPQTAALVEGWRPRFGAPLGHVWQVDQGFRAAEVR